VYVESLTRETVATKSFVILHVEIRTHEAEAGNMLSLSTRIGPWPGWQDEVFKNIAQNAAQPVFVKINTNVHTYYSV
jgi:hypothetical protein